MIDRETKEILIKILNLQNHLTRWTHDALVRTCALREALATQDSTLGERYIEKLDHCDQMDDSALMRGYYEEIEALMNLLSDEDGDQEVIQ
jgi:hypothetical protein